MEQEEWEKLSPEKKKVQLYLKQKKMLEDFLERGAISRPQFDKSLRDLTEKMGMERYRSIDITDKQGSDECVQY